MTHDYQRTLPEYKEWANAMRKGILFCQECGERPKPGCKLEVHHLYYERSRLLWEYSSSEVKVICSDCHKRIHNTSNIADYFTTKETEQIDSNNSITDCSYSDDNDDVFEPQGNFKRDISDDFERELERKIKAEHIHQDRTDDLLHQDNSIEHGWPYGE